MIIFFDLIFQLRNLEYGRKVLYSAYINDKNDIFNYEENSEEWKELKKVIPCFSFSPFLGLIF